MESMIIDNVQKHNNYTSYEFACIERILYHNIVEQGPEDVGARFLPLNSPVSLCSQQRQGTSFLAKRLNQERNKPTEWR
jgi:hypothetical protein